VAKIFVPRNFFYVMQPKVAGVRDKRQVHFHFRPVRPADLLICLDPVSGEVNLSGGTYGPLSTDPFAIALHVHRSSHDSQRNVAQRPPGTEVVVALPSRDLVTQTWHGALPCPRGISEADVARLTLYPSTLVKPPSIRECPVNLECIVEAVYHSGGSDAVFCRVLGATVDEELLVRDRLDLIRQYPTHECDDIDNQWDGAIERLSVLGEILPGPQFPCGPKAGAPGKFDDWLQELTEDGHLAPEALQTLRRWVAEWREIADYPEAAGWAKSRERLSRAIELAAWEEFSALSDFVTTGEENPIP
jgi:flavin reductase (DIM6/NTAB) family NADH-FMN oxidoreductase RutF